MKWGKKFLIYVSSMAFCCLFMLFCFSNELKALDSSDFVATCVDRETTGECTASTSNENAYYILNEIDIGNETLTELVIPDTITKVIDGVSITGNIEILGDGVNEVIKSDNDLNLDSLTLPAYLSTIHQYSLYNITSLKSVTLPTTLLLIAPNVFEENSNIEVIYLNHYELPNLEKLVIDDDAFSGVTLDKIICDNWDIYNHFTDVASVAINELPFVVKVKYNYYPTENENYSDGVSEVEYYAGLNQIITEETIPDAKDLTSEGLNFIGWHLKSASSYLLIEEGKEIKFEVYKSIYNIYPKYELNKIEFNIVAKDLDDELVNEDNVVKYNGGKKVVDLKIESLVIPSNYNKSYTWYRVGEQLEKISNQETVGLSYVNESGKYRCEVSYSYTSSDGVSYIASSSATTSVIINKAKLYVIVGKVNKTYGTYLSKDEITYTTIGLLEEDAINSVEYSCSYSDGSGQNSCIDTNKDIQAGVYNGAIKVEITSIKSEGVEDDKLGNYEIVYSPGNYQVNKKSITISYDETKEFYYGDDIVVKTSYIDEGVYGNKSNIIVITLARANGNVAGTYNIIGVKAINDPEGNSNENYEVSELSTFTGKVIIKPKQVDIKCSVDNSVCDENNIVSVLYNGNKKDLKVYYEDINGVDIEVPYTINDDNGSVSEVVNAGDYSIVATSLLDSNYAFASNNDRVIYLKINKATPIATYSTRQVFTYTGNKINPYITINNSEQTPTYYCTFNNMSGNYCINQGTYNVKVVYQASENYEELVVNGISVYIDYLIVNISPREFSFPYGTTIYGNAKEEIEINGEKVEVVYSVNANSNSKVGSYDITGVTIKDTSSSGDHPNYRGSINYSEGVGKIKVVKRPVEIVYYDYDNLVYNGKERTIGAYAIDLLSNKIVSSLDIEVVCDEGVIKDAKTYHLRSYFTSDYYESSNSNLLVFSIDKAKYDLSYLKFDSKNFTLDFKDHSISIEGGLPEGVSVEYSIDGKEGNSASSAFSHTVVAKFIFDENNYLPINDMKATIYIDMTWAFITMIVTLVVIGIGVSLAWLYVLYRRKHPRKIKLKIKNLVDDDLAAKRVATSVKEVLGDETVEGEHIEDEDDIIEEKGVDRNFIDRIYAASSELKYYYSEVKNELLSYEGISHTVDRKYEVFYHGTRQVAKLSICNGILRLYVNLDPQKYDKSQYNHRDMSKIELHARTPLRIDVNTTESLRHAKVFIRILRKKENLKADSNFVRIDYEKFYTLKENIFPKIFKKMFTIKKDKEKK